jgi:hypothetical protein
VLLVCVRVCRCACVQAYRELGAKRGITKPNMVIPRTAHPAFLKVPVLCVCVHLWTHISCCRAVSTSKLLCVHGFGSSASIMVDSVCFRCGWLMRAPRRARSLLLAWPSTLTPTLWRWLRHAPMYGACLSSRLVPHCALQFPYGSIDPVEDLARLARRKGVGLHVDCCLGSFIVSFARCLAPCLFS